MAAAPADTKPRSVPSCIRTRSIFLRRCRWQGHACRRSIPASAPVAHRPWRHKRHRHHQECPPGRSLRLLLQGALLVMHRAQVRQCLFQSTSEWAELIQDRAEVFTVVIRFSKVQFDLPKKDYGLHQPSYQP